MIFHHLNIKLASSGPRAQHFPLWSQNLKNEPGAACLMVVLLHRAVTSASGFPATSKERQFSSTKNKGEFMMDLYNNQTVKYISISFIYIYTYSCLSSGSLWLEPVGSFFWRRLCKPLWSLLGWRLRGENVCSKQPGWTSASCQKPGQ